MSERDIFTTARELADPIARESYLAQTCAGDDGRRDRIMRLLAADAAPNSMLDVPAVAPRPGATEIPATNDANQVPLTEMFPFLRPSSRPDSLGRLGHYEVLEVLGRGGFGIVFRALDDVLNRMVAVKVLAPELAVTSAARKRFLREARAFALVQHENIVHVYGAEEQPIVHLVMEYVPGQTLQQRLDRTGPLDVPEVLEIGRQIAEGLAAAHATGLIHRDIKPSNVMLEHGPLERVKLTDFGLARAADDASITHSGLVVGTPMYMSPEQAKSERLDHRSDLFSLGSVLYTMVSGRPPFRAANTPAVLKRVADDMPRPIPEIIPEVPSWLCAIITKLLTKSPAGRYQSAREVADLLARCQSSPPVARRSLVRRISPAIGLIGLVLVAWGVREAIRPTSEHQHVAGVESAPTLPDVLPKDTAAIDLDRRAAEWILQTGSWARIDWAINDVELSAEQLSELPAAPFRLTGINLNRNRTVTDQSLAILDGLQYLKYLRLTNTNVSDAVLPYFKHCSKLQKLFLYTTKISDAGLVHLEAFKDLQFLDLSGTRVTEVGVNRLAAALPQCHIRWNGGALGPPLELGTPGNR